jgi:hypothetical protein
MAFIVIVTNVSIVLSTDKMQRRNEVDRQLEATRCAKQLFTSLAAYSSIKKLALFVLLLVVRGKQDR